MTETAFSEIRRQKRLLRKSCREKAALLSSEYRRAASRKITDFIRLSPFYRNASSVFLYLSTETEPDTHALLEQAFADGKKVYVPRCISRTEMKAVRLSEDTELAVNSYGIAEPVWSAGEETLLPGEPDLVVLPCVSASRDGRRLGHGAGYYDRFLEERPGFKVCLCFEALLCADIPVTARDIRMDLVVTECTVPDAPEEVL